MKRVSLAWKYFILTAAQLLKMQKKKKILKISNCSLTYNFEYQIEIFCHQSVSNDCSTQYEVSSFGIPFGIPWQPPYERRRDLLQKRCCAGNN